MARGRPKKIELTLSELVSKAARHEPMTLGEAATLMGNAYYETVDPTTGEHRILEPKKYTMMGLQKFEQRTLAKFKSELSKRFNINSLDDVFGDSLLGKLANEYPAVDD